MLNPLWVKHPLYEVRILPMGFFTSFRMTVECALMQKCDFAMRRKITNKK